MADYSDHETYVEKRYDSPGGKAVLERQNSNFEDILYELGLEEDDSVLEAGSGPALFLEGLEQEATALDLERGPLKAADRNRRADNYVQGDATRLPFRDDSFDYAVASRVFHLDAVDELELLDELERVSRKGFAFDYFRSFSGRAFYNWWMHVADEDMPRSNLHPDVVVDWVLSDHETVERSDFFYPFGYYREEEDPERAREIEESQEFWSDLFDNPWFSLNSVGYRGVDLRER